MTDDKNAASTPIPKARSTTWQRERAEKAEAQLAERDAEIAGLRAYAVALKNAAEPFCNIKADDSDTFNGYADSAVIRTELTVGELKRLRVCAGVGSPIAGSYYAENDAAKETK